MSVRGWSTTALTNGSSDAAINWLENQLPSTVNNSARAMMAEIKKYSNDTDGNIISTGAANEYILATGQTITAFENGLSLRFRADKTCTAAATVVVDALASKSILRSNGTATVARDIVSGSVYELVYSTTASAFLGLNVGLEAEAIIIACSDETTAITAATGKIEFRMPFAFTVTGIRASLTTAQTSGSIFTVDVNEAGTTILSTKLTIDNGEKTTTTAATAAVLSDTALADDAIISVDVDQIGDGTAKGLKVTLIGNRT